jgi:hypothetical protein
MAAPPRDKTVHQIEFFAKPVTLRGLVFAGSAAKLHGLACACVDGSGFKQEVGEVRARDAARHPLESRRLRGLFASGPLVKRVGRAMTQSKPLFSRADDTVEKPSDRP